MGEVNNCDGWLHDEACDFRPLGLSAGDARAEEPEGATLDFTVMLSRPYWQQVTVLYSTSDGTARAWRDYRGQMGYLTFAPGETEKTVSVSVIDDDLEEGAERMWLSLNFQSPAWVRLADPAGMGTIVNADPLPKAWIARFGRSVAEQVLDAMDARMRAKGAPDARIRLAGQRIGLEALFWRPVRARMRRHGRTGRGVRRGLRGSGTQPLLATPCLDRPRWSRCHCGNGGLGNWAVRGGGGDRILREARCGREMDLYDRLNRSQMRLHQRAFLRVLAISAVLALRSRAWPARISVSVQARHQRVWPFSMM